MAEKRASPGKTVPANGTNGTAALGGDGSIVLPPGLRRQFGMREGSLVIIEARAEGILIRPVPDDMIEIYTPERKAEFLLNNAIDAEDYAWALSEARRLGVDPSTIPHDKPPGV